MNSYISAFAGEAVVASGRRPVGGWELRTRFPSLILPVVTMYR